MSPGDGVGQAGAAPPVRGGPGTAPPAQRAGGDPAEISVTSPDVGSLRLYDWGGAGPACLLLHGWGHHGRVWDEVASALRAEGMRPLALDLRGHGRSGWDPSGAYAAEDLRRDVAAAMAALGLDGCALVGHSLGGQVAALAAALAPGSIWALGLLEFSPEADPQAVRAVEESERGLPQRYDTVADYAEALGRAFPLVEPSLLGRLAEHGLARDSGGGLVRAKDPRFDCPSLHDQAARSETAAVWSALRSLDCPVLVVRGVASSVFPKVVAERMTQEVLADATLVTLNGVGHGAHLDNPERVIDTVVGFLRRHRPPSAPASRSQIDGKA